MPCATSCVEALKRKSLTASVIIFCTDLHVLCRSYNMIQPFILAIFLLLSTTTTEAVVAELSSPTFEMFVARFGKAYETMDDFMQRRRIFEKNVEEIVQLNKESSSVLHGINQFSDLTHSEFEARNLLDNDVLKKLLAQRNSLSLSTSFKALDATPGAHNWFSKATTPIRNQGQCGSCWAFSTVEQVESDWFLSGKSGWSKPIELSVQEVVDCDKTDAYACGGTYAGSGSGYDYITKNGGLLVNLPTLIRVAKRGMKGNAIRLHRQLEVKFAIFRTQSSLAIYLGMTAPTKTRMHWSST